MDLRGEVGRLPRAGSQARKARLKEAIEGSDVRFSANLPGQPSEIVEAVKSAGLEGIVAKQKNSVYTGGMRSLAWRKFKLAQSQEFVIGGYNPQGATFSS